MAGKVTDFDALTSPADADVMYIVQTSDNTDKKITVANMKADFGSAQYTVETATDNKTITSTATNYMLIFTRQATAKTITLPAIGTSGRVIRINVTGTGVGNVSLAADSGETVGGFAATDWEWDGTGGLTLIDDGTNWQVLESGIWDTAYSTYDSIDFPQDKNTNGTITRRAAIRSANYTEATFWSLANPILPTTGESASVSGGFGSGAGVITAYMVRDSTTNITLYYITAGTASLATRTINSTATGTWEDTNELNVYIETKNTVWTS